ncbi:Peptidase family M28 [uncultured archaeon]|nr:Peptidase family M28 [uncultured archaeon]
MVFSKIFSRKKIIALFLSLIIFCSSTSVISISYNMNTIQKTNEYKKENFEVDQKFIYQIIENLSHICYNYSQGRTYGTSGENFAANYIYDFMDKINLKNNYLEKICDESLLSIYPNITRYKLIDDKIQINGFSLKIYENGTAESPECFPIASGANNPIYDIFNYNYSYKNLRLLPGDIFDTNFFLQNSISFPCKLNNYKSMIIGEIILPRNDTIFNSYDDNKIILLDSNNSQIFTKQEKDIKYPKFVLSYDSNNKYDSYANTTFIQVSKENWYKIKELVKKENVIITNIISDGNITLIYNYEKIIEDKFGPIDFEYMFIEGMPSINQTYTELKWKILKEFNLSYYSLLFLKTYIWGAIWKIGNKCRGGIIYDNDNETHLMICSLKDYNYIDISQAGGATWPYTPLFSINNTIGSKLYKDACLKISEKKYKVEYYLDQSYNESAISYNVAGNNSKYENDSKIAIISAHYDGYWGQSSADDAVGTSIMLGIAKLIEDYKLESKYKIRYVAFAGEEYGFRGSHFHNLFHFNDSIAYVINFEEEGFEQHNPPVKLLLYSPNGSILDAAEIILEDIGYFEKTQTEIERNKKPGPSDESVFVKRPGINTFCFGKDHNWTDYHKTGLSNKVGDCIDNINKSLLNIVSEFSWRMVEYLLFNPNCWFTNISFTSFNSKNNKNNKNDSIMIHFSINSVIPKDKIMLKIYYRNEDNLNDYYHLYQIENFIIDSTVLKKNIIFSLNDSIINGDYSIKLELYNSTGRINEIMNINNKNYNDTASSNILHLESSLLHQEKISIFNYVFKNFLNENNIIKLKIFFDYILRK